MSHNFIKMNKLYRIIVMWVLLCFTGYEGQSPCDVTADAKLIVESNHAELIVMRIIPFKKLEERKKINDQVKTLGVTPLVDDKYMPVAPISIPYLDLCYVLIYTDKVNILSKYMAHFLDSQDETIIIIIMLLVDNMTEFKKAYDNIPDVDGLDKGIDNQRKPFQNMLKVWAASDRPPDGKVDAAEVEKEAGLLLDEKPKWDETRDQIEKVLMKSSYAMANAILAKYEEKNKHPIEDDIKATIKNADLVDAYSSLAIFIKDKYKCLATKLHDHSDASHNWAVWIILIGILKPDDWKQIDVIFKKDNDNIGLVEFISKNILGDFVLMETFAYLIDPTYKPKFLSIPPPIATPGISLAPAVQPAPSGGGPAPAGQPASNGGGLPPVPPTVVGSAPPPGTPPPATPPPATPPPAAPPSG